MKKTVLVFTLILCALFAFGGCAKSAAQQIAEQLELGQRYLEEGDYEAAIVAFTKAIEIDPKAREVYEQLADLYAGQEQYDQAMEILEEGNRNIGEGTFDDRIRELEAQKLAYDTARYERRYGDDAYEDLMVNLDICVISEHFEKIEDIEDVSPWYGFFYYREHGSYDSGEEFYNETTGMYDIPGDEIRQMLMKYMDFQNLDDLSGLLPSGSYEEGSGSWYEPEADMYHTLLISGFGGTHNGFSDISYETLEPGVIRAMGNENMDGEYQLDEPRTTTIVVREGDDGVLKLMSYTGSWEPEPYVEPAPLEVPTVDNYSAGASDSGLITGYSDQELEQMVRAYRDRHGLYQCQYVSVDHYENGGHTVVIQCYDVVEDDEYGGHTSTADWYTIDRFTGKGHTDFEDNIDLNN